MKTYKIQLNGRVYQVRIDASENIVQVTRLISNEKVDDATVEQLQSLINGHHKSSALAYPVCV
jgi:hypothetical protein